MKNQSTGSGHVAQADRLYYLDWLRVLAILSVLFLHCGKIFDYHTTVVFNTVRSPVLSAYREFGLLWIMPLFFILSGAAVFLSLRSRGKGEFIKARIIRLLIPLVLIGTFIINPPYVYIERLFSGTRIFSMAYMDLAAILRHWDRERISGIWNSFLSTH